MEKTRILIVDDEISIVKLVRANLEANDYEVISAINGEEALKKLEMEMPDLVVLDIMMPKVDGIEVCRRIREWSDVPIIMLSAVSSQEDKIKCLELGADDYITKPFGAGELVARVSAVLRRIGRSQLPPSQPSFAYGNLKVNFIQRKVTVKGKEVNLTPTEYNLLQEFVLNAGKVLTHTHLLHKIWGPEYGDEREYLHVFIPRLRNKIEDDPASPKYIVTVSGVGYKFMDGD